MIDADFVRIMARYNRWQNKGYMAVVEVMDEEELTRDRGAFFGSIFATLNHLLWGDMIWMSRFDGGVGPAVPAAEHTALTPNKSEWARLRFLTDGRIEEWARSLGTVDLVGDLTWYSGLSKKEMSMPKSLCVAHFFNHQTHHRGQVHAMLTAAGQTLPDTDLVFMPDLH